LALLIQIRFILVKWFNVNNLFAFLHAKPILFQFVFMLIEPFIYKIQNAAW